MIKQIVFLLVAVSCWTTISANLAFTDCGSSSNQLPFVVQGIVPLLPPVTVLTGNACNDLIVGSCPAANGNFKTARIVYTVGNALPAVTLLVRFTVRDDFEQQMICSQFQATITGKMEMEN